MTRFLGCHVSASGGLENGLKNGEILGVNTIQVHPCPPQRWNFKPFAPGLEDKFLEMREQSKVKRVFFHGIYLINLANPDPKQFANSKTSLYHDLDFSHRIGGDGVIFHVGSMKHQESFEDGLKHAAEGVNWIMDKSKGNARLLLEVAAGSGQVIGSRMEELATIYEHVEHKDNVGFALDTQHLWASGYDLKNDLDGVIKSIEKNFTFEKVWAVHLNDSKTLLGSKTDRHENLGQGEIGLDALTAFVNHPKLVSIPFILETPGLKAMDTAQGEVDILHRIARNPHN